MKIASVRIDGGEPIELKMDNFVNIRRSHAHLFKHVVRISEKTPFEPKEIDPEGWSELIPSPPLEKSITKRKSVIGEQLSWVDGCTLGRLKETESAPCYSCTHRRAQTEVSDKVNGIMQAYIAAARGALIWCMENPGPKGARVISYWKEPQRTVRIVAQEPGGVRTVADLNTHSKEMRVISCFRKDREKNYKSSWIDMCREQSGYRRQGNAATVDPVKGSSDV